MSSVVHQHHLQWYDFGFYKAKQVRVEADMLLEQVQPPLQTDLFLQGAVEVFHWTLHVSTCLLALHLQAAMFQSPASSATQSGHQQQTSVSGR